ncbi:hypothetical protein BHE74_00004481 [Ensete ventricosum]|nr:hypothetical protein BHE74_00004481 [Ensete ventricosum]
MVQVNFTLGPKGDLGVMAVPQPLFHHESSLSFSCRGAVSLGCRYADNDDYLLFNWSIQSGGGISFLTGALLKSSLISDELMKVSGSSLLCVRPSSEAVVGLGRELVMKLSSNSLAKWSKDEMEDDSPVDLLRHSGSRS